MTFSTLGVTAEMIAGLILADDTGKPRSQQKAVGPSGIGTPCDRQLGYRILATPKVGHGGDPLPRWLGTEGHRGLERILTPLDDWETEFAVTLPEYGIKGHADAYHKPSGTVVDFKFVGQASLTKYKALGPGPQYRVQAHLYGTGLTLTGRDVNHVAIAFIPRSGLTSSIHVWSEPYDAHVTEAALRRYEAVTTVAQAVGPGDLATADGPCDWCPWYRPGHTDPATGCAGHTDSLAAG